MRPILLVIVLGLAAPARADVVRPSFEDLEAGATALETYRLNALAIAGDSPPAWPTLFGGSGRWWRPVRGSLRQVVGHDDFFRALGRGDLAQQHRQQRLVAGIFYWGGAVAFVGGAVLMVMGLRAGGSSTATRWGAGLMIGGVVENAVGGVIQPPLVSEADAVALADAYNRQLRLHLGLAASDRALSATLRARW